MTKYLTKAKAFLKGKSRKDFTPELAGALEWELKDADLTWGYAVLAFARMLDEDGYCTLKERDERGFLEHVHFAHHPTPCAPGCKFKGDDLHEPGANCVVPRGGTEEEHRIGEHGAVGWATKDGRVCAECGEKIEESPKPVEEGAWMHWRSPELEERLDRLLPLLERLLNASRKHD